MTLLVLGAGGQVAAALRWRAMARGVSVIGMRHDELDIVDAEHVRHVVAELRPAMVINCAGYTAVDQAEADEAAAFRVNRDGAGNVALAAALSAVPLIHLSSDYVFDGTKGTPYREDDAVAPLGAYARSKEAGERAVRDAWGKHIILRTAWVFGAMGRNFAKTMLTLAEKGPCTIDVVDDQVGGPTPADAVADACLDIARRIATADIVPWGTYHFCGQPTVSRYDFACAILAGQAGVTVRPCRTAEVPRPAPRPANAALDCTRIRAAFGIETPDWRRHLAAMLAELRGE